MGCNGVDDCSCSECNKIITRKEASESNRKRFYTGRLCGKGHDAERYTASGNCVKCASKSSSAFSQALKASRFADGIVEYKRVVHKDLVATLDAVIEANSLGQTATVPIPSGKWACQACSHISDTAEISCPGCGVYDNYIPGAI